MTSELDVVALTRDIDGTHLKKGDLGTVVLVYGDSEAYMVEFVLHTGFTAALTDLEAADVRPLNTEELKGEQRREWKPGWTRDELGYVPYMSKLLGGQFLPDGQCPEAHYLPCVDGTGT